MAEKLFVSGARGASVAELARRTGSYGVLPTDTDLEVLGKFADAAILQNPGFKGNKGDPGGNVMSIGLFTQASTLNIPIGTDTVQTSGYASAGVGSGRYRYDAAVDAAFVTANPRISFISANARGFRLIADTVFFDMVGADPTGATSAVAAFNAALSVGTRVMGAPNGIYLLDASVTVPAGREVFGNGATVKIASGLTGGLRLANDRCKVSGWRFEGSGGGYAVWAAPTGSTPVRFVEFTGNLCTGNIGHFILCTNAEHVLISGNEVDGLSASTEITTAFVAENCRHVLVTDNRLRNIPIGWGVQIRDGSTNFKVNDNDFLQKQYSDSKTAVASQTVFTFTLEEACFLRKVQVNGKPLSTGYTVTGTNPYTVTFASGRAAGEVIKLVGYRGAENIQINGASKHGTVNGNTVDGTADSGIIALGSNITISGNAVRKCGYAGIAIYGDQDGIVVADNLIEDCAQMDDGLSSPDFPELSSPFAGAILASGSAAAISGNIIRNPAGTMRYAIMVNKTDMTLRTDGTPTIAIGPNIYDGVYADGKLSMPNQNPGQRVNSVMVDGVSVIYPKQIDIDSPWVEFPAASGRFQPADTDFYTVDGSTLTRAVRDTAVKLGGVASLQTVPGEFIDFNLTAAGMLFNCIVTVTFWAKAVGGTSLVEVITTLEGLDQPLGAPITDTNWRQYSISFALTPNLAKAVRIRCSANAGSSANIQHIQVTARRL